LTAFGGSLILLLYVFGSLYGYFIGLVLSEFIVSIILFSWFFTRYKVVLSKVSGSLAIDLIKFGIPLLITELSYLLLSYADRYMIAFYKGADAVGLYSVGYNVASYISDTMMFSLSYAVVPIYLSLHQKEGRKKTEEFLQRCLHYLLIIIIPICIGYTLVSRDLLLALATDKYLQAATFSPIILLGAFFLGMNNILNAGLYLEKKTRIILAIMLSAVTINIVMNLLLLPVYGIMGSAVATLTACMAATILTVIFSFRHLTIKINTRLLIYHAALSGIMALVIVQIDLRTAWMDLAVKVLAGMLIIFLGILVLESEIRDRIKTALQFKKPLYGIR